MRGNLTSKTIDLAYLSDFLSFLFVGDFDGERGGIVATDFGRFSVADFLDFVNDAVWVEISFGFLRYFH